MAKNEDYEPGQDPLIKEDKGRTSLRRMAKEVKPGINSDERFYTDHDAGNPRSLDPQADSSRKARQKSQRQGPVRAGAFSRLKTSLGGLRAAWRQAVADADRKQQEKRSQPKKGLRRRS